MSASRALEHERSHTQTGAHLITEEPPASAWTNDYIQQALDALEGEDLDLTGENFEPIEVTLNEGGN